MGLGKIRIEASHRPTATVSVEIGFPVRNCTDAACVVFGRALWDPLKEAGRTADGNPASSQVTFVSGRPAGPKSRDESVRPASWSSNRLNARTESGIAEAVGRGTAPAPKRQPEDG